MQLPSAEQLQDNEYQFKAGRPRSEESRRAILDSTRRLLTHMPVSKISIEARLRPSRPALPTPIAAPCRRP